MIFRAPEFVKVGMKDPTFTTRTDGAYLPQVPYGGTGGVLRYKQGQFVAAFVHRVDYISSPLHAELLAVKQGMQLLQSMQVASAVIESDCQVAVTAITSIRLRFVRRQANTVAHRLASQGFESNINHEWFVNAPEIILDALMYDSNRIH
ncbi:uncharacterized protein LOC121050763 [Rosa chinensis]|uniref:uncharacterized protein LOC121050763 n=1 Tax=Rosa chinensis TaxID=74649 RepID=UPI001AD8DB48|nr:uncharacterized protein LOC121050763 [Rosa chinensis]